MTKKKSDSIGDGELVSFQDPLASLPPVPRNLLQAARRLLDRHGFEALRLDAIAAQAGEPKGSIGYYFGNKAGLVAALVDYLAHDAIAAEMRATEGLPIGEQRVRALIGSEERIAADLQSFRSFFEILPHVLRDDDLRDRIAHLYDNYRESALRGMAGADDEQRKHLSPYAMATIALIDGLAIQQALDPQGIDISPATQLWERLLVSALRNGESENVARSERAPQNAEQATEVPVVD